MKHRLTGEGYRKTRQKFGRRSVKTQFSLVVGGEGDVNYSPLALLDVAREYRAFLESSAFLLLPMEVYTPPLCNQHLLSQTLSPCSK